MALEETRGTVWRKARAAAVQQTCSASRCTSRPGEFNRKHINLGMPLKAHRNNRSSFPGCEACRAQSLDRGDRAGRRWGLAASRIKICYTGASEEETSPGSCSTCTQEHHGTVTWLTATIFPFLSGMDVYSWGHSCTYAWKWPTIIYGFHFFLFSVGLSHFSIWFYCQCEISVDDDDFIKMFGYLLILFIRFEFLFNELRYVRVST